jgi:hypothetical protein
LANLLDGDRQRRPPPSSERMRFGRAHLDAGLFRTLTEVVLNLDDEE